MAKTQEDNEREIFLETVHGLVNSWNNFETKDTEEKLNGLAFSIMNLLDENFIVTPREDESIDISGILHEQFYEKK